MLNARGSELSGYDLRETSGGWGPQVAPNRKAGCRGWSRSVTMTVRSVRRHVLLYVSICRAAVLRPTLSRFAYDPVSVCVTPGGDLLPATVVAYCADRHPVAKTDPQSRCRRDGATARRAPLAPGMQRLRPQARKFDLLPHATDARAFAPYRLRVCCFAPRHRQLCSEAGGSSDRLCRVDRCRLVRLEPIVQMKLLRGSLLMPFPAKRLVAIGRFGTMHGSLESHIGFIGFDPGGTPSPDAMPPGSKATG